MDEIDMQVLLSLAETGNLSKTAARLYLAQPTLTKRLQNIEKELGTALFLRSKSGVTLTPAGERAIQTASQITRSLDELRAYIEENQDFVSGSLTVASSLDFSKYCMPDIIEQYARSYPKVTLQVSTAHSRNNFQQLLDRKCHAAILRGEYPWDDEKKTLSTEAFCLIRNKCDEGKPLSELPYISRYTDNPHMNLQTRWLIENHLSPKSTLNVDALSTCVTLTQKGLGWSIVPEICLHDFEGIREPLYFNDGTPLTRSTYLMWRKKDEALPQLKAFTDIVLSYAEEHLS